MSEEKRLIDANVLADHIKDLPTSWDDGCGACSRPMKYPDGMFDCEDVIGSIEDAPTVDAVEIPCRIGDTVWAIRTYRGHKRPQKGLVKEMYFLPDMTLQIVVSHIARGKFGETVFLTEAETLNAINGERKENG